uniref:VWFA domain-containing protein n=1 Tax=viral metagenome TaxID=1070528 RepID=A0A6C0DXC4_9ZZZZ
MASFIQEVVAIIDRSGSMSGKEADTVGGINSTLDIIRQDLKPGERVNVSIKLFDHEEHMLIRSLNIEDVRPLELRQFVPRGQTALYDAIGSSLTYFMEKKLHDPSSYTKCLIYVATDGCENCSKKFNALTLKKLITSAQESYNIEIMYLGANQDAILEASKIGIEEGHAINFSETKEECEAVYRSLGNVVNRQKSSAKTTFTPAERSQSYTPITPPPSTRSSEPPPLRRQTSMKYN